MSLTPGTRLGPYEVTAQIGVGGMGEVYRATDTNLKRQVAIKVLPDTVATDPERLARFRREAEVLAALNHPNIAHIHGLEKSDGQVALVMELVEGPTLADRIARGPITIDEALPIARQIAEALEAAHEQGIVHRDLKPANIKVKDDGTVKVLDFGLAKALEPAGAAGSASASMSPTLTSPAMTQMGMILGTAAYMSPEQARGRPVDKRADIWAFGCVLYEMLTGHRAFAGEDISLTLAAVLRADVPLDTLPAETPARVRQVLGACLQRDPKQRVHDIADVRLALDGAFETAAPQAAAAVAAARPTWRQALPLAAALVAGVLVTAGVGWMVWPTSDPGLVRRFSTELPDDLAFRNPNRRMIALAPDASAVVYNTNAGLYLRAAGALEAQLIPGTETPLTDPVFSPDGQQVAYWSNREAQLKRIATTGGAPVVIASNVTVPFGLSWAAAGVLLVGQPDGIYQVPATGGTPELVIPARDGERVFGPELLPDGESVLFSATTAGWDEARIVVQSRRRDDRTVLVEGGNDARYVPTGHLVYALGNALFGMAFDPAGRAVSGGAVPLVQRVRRSGTTGAAQYSLSANGELAYVPGGEEANSRSLVWVDTAGRTTALPTPPGAFETVDLTADGRLAALGRSPSGSGDPEVWVSDLERGTLSRLTSEAGFDGSPLWSPDGRRVAYVSNRSGTPEVRWQPVDGSGGAEALATFDGPVSQLVPGSWTPDGSQLVLAIARQGDAKDIGVVTVGAPRSFKALVESPFDERNPSVSPDGRWMAYASNETGAYQVYVQRFPAGGGRQQVSSEPGYSPKWSADGRSLSFARAGPGGPPAAIARLSVTPGPDPSAPLQFGAPKDLFPYAYFSQPGGQWWFDMTADGERFLVITGGSSGADTRAAEIMVVQHWTEELKRLVPTR